ncbi:MAG TPA: hypothetical protein VLG47_07805, partial [Candidatus Saccharimonadales bacterium]|nr:hypothetical protein [Candidatus Saccharimonadales bacterium]
IVKGDANKIADPPIVPNQVVGKVVKSVPHLGCVVNALHTPIGLILIVYIPAIILVAYEIKLLVQRLTRLEVAKREGQSAGDNPRSSFQPKPMPAMAQSQQAATATIKQPATVAPIERDDIPAVVHTHRVVRSIDGIRVVFAIVIMTFVVGSTFASLQSTAKLTGNSITVTFPNN